MPPPADRVRFTRPSHMEGLELVEVSYGERSFPLHIHEHYVVGVMTAGAERLSIRGAEHLASPGDLILIEPGEAHSNVTAGEAGLGYRVFYIPPPLMEQAAGGPVRFLRPVAPGGEIARQLVEVHRMLQRVGDRLEQESAFFGAIGDLVEREGGAAPPGRPAEQRQVALAREYLDRAFAESVSLKQLAQLAGLSPFHLLRSFRDQVGLTPGAYQIQLRVREARRLLRNGLPIAETAAALGFADQSHLTRHFQRIVGTSPGRYAPQ